MCQEDKDTFNYDHMTYFNDQDPFNIIMKYKETTNN